MRTRSNFLALTAILSPLLISASAIPSPAGLTVVELFTSQGCSSCPPANATLAMLAATRTDVVPLSFGVTYWDKLGWKDSFAKPAFTQRQWDYAAALGHDNVATPQMVINGRVDITGNRPRALAALIGRVGPVSGPKIIASGKSLMIAAGIRPALPADVWLVRYDPRILQVPVAAGENSGRTLPHRNVVCEMIRLGRWNGAAERLSLPSPSSRLKSVILLQAAKAGPILAVARVDGAGG